MTCKDCIHYDICIQKADMEYGIEKTQMPCTNFIDKSRYIELPCKVGDEVFWITSDNKIRCNKVFSIKIESEDDHYTFYVKCRIFNQISMFYTFVFGRDCFLTREEAEKALKEQTK